MKTLKRHYWGFKKYNTKTGLYKGEKRHHTVGRVSDWNGRTVETQGRGAMGRNGYDD